MQLPQEIIGFNQLCIFCPWQVSAMDFFMSKNISKNPGTFLPRSLFLRHDTIFHNSKGRVIFEKIITLYHGTLLGIPGCHHLPDYRCGT